LRARIQLPLVSMGEREKRSENKENKKQKTYVIINHKNGGTY